MVSTQQLNTESKLARMAARKQAEESATRGETPTVATAAPIRPAARRTPAESFIEPSDLATVPGLSQATEKADADYRKRFAAWNAERERLATMRDVADIEAITYADIQDQKAAAIQTELSLAQAAAELWRLFTERLTARAPELSAYVAAKEKALAEVVEDVTAKLHAAGVSVETQRGYPHAMDAAEIQFAHTIRLAKEWQTANSELADANTQMLANQDAIGAGRMQIESATVALRQKVERLIA
ncbi:hypothetical protein [Lacipirellula limnantheis]|uniref:Uncharacterized protein n=1 Tax=Lacipirellula limnantheis TaxID=2528024 RepID=A0A517U081_9BACT|nr:hypothetical protein [Lacipirellula limnantheis]QDT74038.1 hypothetical protein I41_32320 [Lacipirellula limnantheis]